jgi:hypothetical protein
MHVQLGAPLALSSNDMQGVCGGGVWVGDVRVFFVWFIRGCLTIHCFYLYQNKYKAVLIVRFELDSFLSSIHLTCFIQHAHS